MAKHERIRIAPATAKRFWEKVDKAPGQGPGGDCWVWTASRHRFGYGTFGVKLAPKRWKIMTAHRVAYMIASGRDPSPLCVCHSCDNPPCVNPAHLWVGRPLDNMRDRDAKGRGGGAKRRGKNNGRYTHPEATCRGDAWQAAHAASEQKRASSVRKFHAANPGVCQGSRNSKAKLTESDVRTIRGLREHGDTYASLARRYDVTKTCIRDICIGKRWSHVTLTPL